MPQKEGYLSKLKFLVVDDNAFMRSIIRRVLSALEVDEARDANDGEAALKILDDYAPDIIITDWKMEPVDGVEFTRKLRRDMDSPNPFIPIIMVSGYGDMSRIIEARDAGVNEYVVKPFSATTLFSRIQAVIERPRAFVRVKNFFGPDRRRKDMDVGEKDRRTGVDMAQEDVDALMNPDQDSSEAGAIATGQEDANALMNPDHDSSETGAIAAGQEKEKEASKT